MADAAYAVVCNDSSAYTGQFLTDEGVLREQRLSDFSQYMVNPDKNPIPDFYL